MAKTPLFTENQRPSRYPAYPIITGLLCLSIWAVVAGPLPVPQDMLPLILGLFLGLAALFFLMIATLQLNVRVGQTGIFYRCFPLQVGEKFIDYRQIDRIIIGKIKVPFRYGTFKIRAGLRSSLYLFGGYDALQIHRKDGRIIILGTHQAERLYLSLRNVENEIRPVITGPK